MLNNSRKSSKYVDLHLKSIYFCTHQYNPPTEYNVVDSCWNFPEPVDGSVKLYLNHCSLVSWRLKTEQTACDILKFS